MHGTKPQSKTRRRVGQRGSVTWMLGQLDATMEENNTRELKQLKLSLGEKLVLLAKLDEEIQCEIDDKSGKRDQSCKRRERINLALIMINKALDALTGRDP